jgi:hypothetical protein
LQSRDVKESHPTIVVILNEVKNLVPRVLGRGSVEAGSYISNRGILQASFDY